ncbi:hypothetical protein ACUODJ_34095, partial [Escherichia sp. HC-CC]
MAHALDTVGMTSFHPHSVLLRHSFYYPPARLVVLPSCYSNKNDEEAPNADEMKSFHKVDKAMAKLR